MATKPRTSKASTTEVTSASEWRSAAKEGHLLELPSGNRARVRRTLNLMKMLKAGRIPNPLQGLVQDMVNQNRAAPDMSKATPESMQQMLDLVDSQIPIIFIEPKVERAPEGHDPDIDGPFVPSDPNAVALDDIDIEDRMFVFTFAQGGPSEVASFREGQVAALASLGDGEGLEGEAEPSA